jgi:LacI family repressor for deo operon, udp, cdd, tsx, nupC, and nupG
MQANFGNRLPKIGDSRTLSGKSLNRMGIVKNNNDLPQLDGSGPTMVDVARRAGVATSTVSRALANPERVNEKTRARINAAAHELGYTPNAAARNLRVGKSNTILIILPGSLHYGVSQVIPQVLQSINQALIRDGFNLMIANVARDADSERHILDLAFGGSVRGCISLSEQLPADGGRSLADLPLPIVSLLLDMSDASLPSVVTNDRQAVKEAAEELIALGHSRFFYISGPVGNYHDVERYAGLLEAAQAAGLSERDIVQSSPAASFQVGLEAGVRAADEFVQLAEKPTAAVAVSDDMAIGFVSRLQRLGWSVPDDVSVISFDGSPACEYYNPPLSTIVQPVAEMGAAAVRLLLERLDKADARDGTRLVIPSRLVHRGSVGRPKP